MRNAMHGPLLECSVIRVRCQWARPGQVCGAARGATGGARLLFPRRPRSRGSGSWAFGADGPYPLNERIAAVDPRYPEGSLPPGSSYKSGYSTPVTQTLSDTPLQPSGTFTFLFTDIEGSTRAWERRPAQMGAAMAQHDRIVAEAIAQHGGRVTQDHRRRILYPVRHGAGCGACCRRRPEQTRRGVIARRRAHPGAHWTTHRVCRGACRRLLRHHHEPGCAHHGGGKRQSDPGV